MQGSGVEIFLFIQQQYKRGNQPNAQGIPHNLTNIIKKRNRLAALLKSRTPGTTVTVAAFRPWRGWRRYRRPAQAFHIPLKLKCPYFNK